MALGLDHPADQLLDGARLGGELRVIRDRTRRVVTALGVGCRRLDGWEEPRRVDDDEVRRVLVLDTHDDLGGLEGELGLEALVLPPDVRLQCRDA